MIRKLFCAALAFCLPLAPVLETPAEAQPPVSTQSQTGLRAGAARLDITPGAGEMPKPFATVDSALYARALVLDSGGRRVVFVVGDLPTIVPDVFTDLNRRVAEAAGVPVENVMLAVTHTHNAVRLDNAAGGLLLPGSADVTRMTGERIVAAVHQAVEHLEPARAGYGSAPFHLALGSNAGLPAPLSNTAHEIGVLKVESATGATIALLVNNGPEPVFMLGRRTEISADLAGAATRYVEQRFGEKAVVLYTVGSPPAVAMANVATVPGASPADPHALVRAVGTVLGEDILAAAAAAKTSPELSLAAAGRVLTCPGKATTPLNNPNTCSDAPGATLPPCVFTDHDAPPVNLRIEVLRLGGLSIVGTDANIDAAVWAETQARAAEPAKTLLVAQIFGPMHYVEPDGAYPTNSYQVTASTAKRGCAEKGFMEDTVTLLKSTAASH